MTFRMDDWLEQWKKSEEGLGMLNFDADSKKHALKIASHLLKVFKGCEIYFRRSSSGKGFHFVVAVDGKPLYVDKRLALALRQYCGDCYGRIRVDRQRLAKGRQVSILFSWKNGRKAGKWVKIEKLKQLREVRM